MRALFSAALVTILLLVLAPGSAFAAAPNRDVISGSDHDTDFCGTGETVNVTFEGILNSWDDQAFGHIQWTWTNPANGASVVESFSGGGKVSFIDDGDGAYTIVLVRQGLPEQLRMVGGGLLAHDAGLVAVYDHFDADGNYLGTDVVVLAGPHPFKESESDLFCDLMIEALGL
jgi:hypothetical protein